MSSSSPSPDGGDSLPESGSVARPLLVDRLVELERETERLEATNADLRRENERLERSLSRRRRERQDVVDRYERQLRRRTAALERAREGTEESPRSGRPVAVALGIAKRVVERCRSGLPRSE